MKEMFRVSILLAGILLISMGLMNWIHGLQATAKFMAATGIWFELHLLSTLQEDNLGQ